MRMFMKKNEKVSQSWEITQNLYSTWTNLQYNAVKVFTDVKQFILEPRQDLIEKKIVIQGKLYKNRKEAKIAVQQIMWFSYRKGFNIGNEFKSDVGWGCLVRVGQMALASALRKYLEAENKNFKPSSIIENLIAAFNDFKGSYGNQNYQGQQEKYSLNKIIEIAEKTFRQKPGQWFNLCTISRCLKIAQNNLPMKGSENLEIVFFYQSINVPTIYKIQGYRECSCSKKKIVCQNCFSNQNKSNNLNESFETLDFPLSTNDTITKHKIKITQTKNFTFNQSKHIGNPSKNYEKFKQKKLNRDNLLLVLTRVGDQRSVSKVNEAIFSLLDLNTCLGIMTGFPRKAIFVVGREEDQLIYLDPHYVQENKKIEQEDKSSYFCKEYLLTERTKLDPSMTFCFYIHNLLDLENLCSKILFINQKYPNQLSIGIDFQKLSFNKLQYQEFEQDTRSLKSNFYNDM